MAAANKFSLLVSLLIAFLLGTAIAQTVTVTVNTCAPTTVTVTQAAPTPCSTGFNPITNGNFETGALTPWTAGSGTVSVVSSCGQQGTIAAPGKCVSLKPIGNGAANVQQTLNNLCPGRTYKVTFNIGLPKTFTSLATNTRLPTFTLTFGSQTFVQPVCSSSVGQTNPCTQADIYGNYVFRTVTWTSAAVGGSIGGVDIKIADDLVANLPVLVDSISATLI